jgi:PPK2 family polyphosphate:nucleotide phosphotransferase
LGERVKAMDFGERFRVTDSGFRLADRDPADRAGHTKKQARKRRATDLERLAELQDKLNAEGTRALLMVVQGLDAAGKDGTIKHVMRGVNPQGVAVSSFKQPTSIELGHDFLWRAQLAVPARGRIGVFNRSHYEEVLVVRVHPDLLAAQKIDPARAEDSEFWKKRFEDIATWERHLARSGTQVVKFFLHVSKAEQRRRILDRIERPEKNWKYSAADVHEHEFWEAYQQAYQAALRATSTRQAPWYVIPADHKWFLRTVVAGIVVEHLIGMDPKYPIPSQQERRKMREAAAPLRAES